MRRLPSVSVRPKGRDRPRAYRFHPPGSAEGRWAIHSITSSARKRKDSGIVNPSAFAVLRLTTSSNFVGSSMGRSAGLAPLRFVHEKRRATKILRFIDTVANERAVHDDFTGEPDCRQTRADYLGIDATVYSKKQTISGYDQRLDVRFNQCCDCGIEFVQCLNLSRNDLNAHRATSVLNIAALAGTFGTYQDTELRHRGQEFFD